MPRGGPRPGAGRKKGSLTQRTREIAERAIAEGLTPLDVMLSAMHAFHQAGELEKAAKIAHDAAPYVHPRLAAIEYSSREDQRSIQELSDEELMIMAAGVWDTH